MSNPATNELPLAHSKAGQNIKAQRVPESIKVHTAIDTGIDGLHIYPHGHRKAGGIDPRHYLTDAKRIYAWIIWHLPAGTVEKLRDLIISKDIA